MPAPRIDRNHRIHNTAIADHFAPASFVSSRRYGRNRLNTSAEEAVAKPLDGR
jgi:hypothetical protein